MMNMMMNMMVNNKEIIGSESEEYGCYGDAIDNEFDGDDEDEEWD